MRKHALYASAVVASEEFLSMDTASQALYFQLLCEAETDGELVNVNRIVRATGLGQEALAGLFERDYLIEVGGHIYVRHNWQNNKLNAKVWKSMDSCEPYLSGQLEFEGIEGKTPYRISHTEVSPDRKQGDTQVTPSSETGNNMDTCNSTCTDTNTCNDTGTSTMYGEGDSQGGGDVSIDSTIIVPPKTNLHPCMCGKCTSGTAHYWQTDGKTFITCTNCGTYEYIR